MTDRQEALDALDLAIKLQALIAAHEEAVTRLAPLRRAAFRRALDLNPDWTYAELGKVCGISRSRVSVLVSREEKSGG